MLRSLTAPLRGWAAALAAGALLSAPALAQDAGLKKADRYFDQEDYHTAAARYEDILKTNPNSGIAQFKAGVCYLYTGKPEQGLTYIRDSRQKPLAVDAYYFFWLGKAYHLNMRIDSALVNYRRYLALAPATDEFRKGTENLIAQAHRSESFFLSPDASPLQARNLGENLNSPYTERNPLVTADGKVMVFMSRRPLSPDESPEPDGEFTEKSFLSTLQADGSWGKAQPLLVPSDRKSWYSVTQMLEGGAKILLVRETGNNAGFYTATRQGEGYGLPERLDLGLKEAVTGFDVSFSADLKFAVFSRLNRNTGDLDLHSCKRLANGTWTKPARLSGSINTTENELSPVLSEDGKTLYFASKGHDGLGGYDIFRSKIDEATGRWTTAEPLGLPYNSPGNDISYTEYVRDGKKVGYLSAARPKGYGEADLYEIDFAGAQAEAK